MSDDMNKNETEETTEEVVTEGAETSAVNLSKKTEETTPETTENTTDSAEKAAEKAFPTNSDEAPKKNKTGFIIIGVVLALIVIAAGVFVVSMLKTKFYKKAVLLGAVFAYLYTYLAVEPYDYQVPFVEEAEYAQVEAWEEYFAEGMELKTETVPNFDNVIICVFK